ncbi:MAG: hypothetical protein ACLSE9_09305 [Acutalibacteraceae bacterium]
MLLSFRCVLGIPICTGWIRKKRGAEEYYDSLFKLYASWGVDFVKVDDIANTEFSPQNPYSAEKEIEMIRAAIDRSGRDMVLSLSPGPAPLNKAEHLSENANMWRISGDFWDRWDKLLNMFFSLRKVVSVCERRLISRLRHFAARQALHRRLLYGRYGA